MIVLENSPALRRNPRSSRETELRVERTDILFSDLAGDRVRIQVTVHNTGIHPSPPTLMRLESAPLGAFVPWRPLARLLVPAMDPGESRVLSTEVVRPRPGPLGDFNRVPPKKLLTAVTSPSDVPRPQPGARAMAIFNLLGLGRTKSTSLSALAPDLLDLVGRDHPHWAGNINVFIGTTSVERHVAKALRVYPGRANMAMFIVGTSGRRDAYAFELAGLPPDWKALLYDVSLNQNLEINREDAPIEEMHWVESNGALMVMLAARPPADCQTGNLEVHVTRRSCGKTAVVEFSLDPRAQGAGCYSA